MIISRWNLKFAIRIPFATFSDSWTHNSSTSNRNLCDQANDSFFRVRLIYVIYFAATTLDRSVFFFSHLDHIMLFPLYFFWFHSLICFVILGATTAAPGVYFSSRALTAFIKYFIYSWPLFFASNTHRLIWFCCRMALKIWNLQSLWQSKQWIFCTFSYPSFFFWSKHKFRWSSTNYAVNQCLATGLKAKESIIRNTNN